MANNYRGSILEVMNRFVRRNPFIVLLLSTAFSGVAVFAISLLISNEPDNIDSEENPSELESINHSTSGDNSPIVSEVAGDVSININSSFDPRIPPAPPDIDAPILTKRELFDMEYGLNSGCYPEGERHKVILSNNGQEDIYSADPLVYFLINSESILHRYYLDLNSMSNVDRSWIGSIMVPGRHLEIEFAQCGNGALRFLTYIEALRSNS